MLMKMDVNGIKILVSVQKRMVMLNVLNMLMKMDVTGMNVLIQDLLNRILILNQSYTIQKKKFKKYKIFTLLKLKCDHINIEFDTIHPFELSTIKGSLNSKESIIF